MVKCAARWNFTEMNSYMSPAPRSSNRALAPGPKPRALLAPLRHHQPSLHGTPAPRGCSRSGAVCPLYTVWTSGIWLSFTFVLLWDSATLFCVVSAHSSSGVFCCVPSPFSVAQSPGWGCVGRCCCLPRALGWTSVRICVGCLLGAGLLSCRDASVGTSPFSQHCWANDLSCR